MFRSVAWLLLLLVACKTESNPPSQDKALASTEDQGPSVASLVKPEQEKWLAGQVQNPTAARFNSLLIFGDSLSDTGNLNKLSLGGLAPPRVFYKSRFSNGPIWADYLASSLNWTMSNYAVAFAKTHGKLVMEPFTIPSFEQQISDHKSELKTMDFARTLVVVWIGASDYLTQGVDAQDANQNPIPEKLNEQVKDAVDAIRDGIDDLQDIGFKNFALATLPELGGINRSPKEPPRASDATLAAATAAHNTALRTMLSELAKELPHIKLSLFQAYEINQKTSKDPKAYGFSRMDAPCFAGNMQGRFDGAKVFCNDPKAYKFWDYLHPSSKMHCLYASQFLADMSAAAMVAGYDQNKAIARCLEL